jgi:Carboxypeptidase regulatory-like domain
MARVSQTLTARDGRFLLVPAMIAIVLLAATAPRALAVNSLSGEGLTGTGKSTGGSTSGGCPNRASESGSMGFSASGTATGPYPGSFSETGSFSLSGIRNPPWTIHFSATFTIKSGNTKITGSFASPSHAWWGVGFICNSAGGVAGYSLSGPVTYTATINGQTFQGTGSFTGTLYAQSGATDSVSESVTVSYGQITGAAIDGATSAPIAGICVKAYNSSGGVLASAQTNSSGVYTLSSVPAGSAQVGFSSGCGASNYLARYYNAKPSLASANAITVPAGGTASGINAAMLAGGQITGTVTASATKTALAAICVQAYNSGGVAVASSQTNSSGVYTLSALPTGSYQVGFMDCNAGTYVTQYYHEKATLASADPIAVTAGTTTSGINAAMVTQGQITGTVTDRATHAPLAGICATIWDSSVLVVGPAVSTDASGVYTSPRLAAGSYRVEFANCAGSTYAEQYYNDRATLASADPVTVTDGTTTSGINAAMVAGGQITGTVSDSVTRAPVASICVEALDSSGNGVGGASTDANGAYTISGLQTGLYRVEFYSNCPVLNFVTQYYNGKATLANADAVAVTAGATASGINALIVKGGEITGTATDSATGAGIFGICVDAFDTNGNEVGMGGYTGGAGAYTIYNAPPGAVRIEFYSQPTSYSNVSCGGTNYVTQYYNHKSSLATADPVSVNANATTSGINTAMTAG